MKTNLAKKTVSFEEAKRKLPQCCYGAWENLREDSGQDRIQDLVDAAKHELELHYEAQDSCLTTNQAWEVEKYLKWLHAL